MNALKSVARTQRVKKDFELIKFQKKKNSFFF